MKIPAKLPACLLFISSLIFAHNCVAQKVEFSVNANTGLFNYTGSGINEPSNPNSFPDQYGSKLTASYGANLQTQVVYNKGFLMGFQAGYDFLRSKTAFSYTPNYYTLATPLNLVAAAVAPVNGNSISTNQYINLNPYAGYRFKGKSITVDVTGGAEIGFQTKNRQSITTSNDEFKSNDNLDYLHNDIRLKAGAAIGYKRLSLNLSYAHGVTNFVRDYIPPSPNSLVLPVAPSYSANNTPAKISAYSQLIRAGIGYRLF